MNKNSFKKIISVLVVLCLMLGVLQNAYAEDVSEESTPVMIEDETSLEQPHEVNEENVTSAEEVLVDETPNEAPLITTEEEVQLYFNENTAISQIATSGTHSMMLFANGDVYTSGNNQYGQLGNGEISNSNTVVTYPVAQNIVKVAAGKFHSLALTSDGRVLSWGNNQYGQLGRTNGETSVPMHVVDGDGDIVGNVADISAGTFGSMILKSDGTVWTFGYNVQGQLGCGFGEEYSAVPQMVMDENNESIGGIVQIKSGPYHCLALSEVGYVYAWGQGNHGRLGQGSIRNLSYATLVKKETEGYFLEDIVKIGVGSFNSFAIADDNTVYAWGRNDMGQLGIGDTDKWYYPQEVVIGTDEEIADISGGDYHTVALTSEGNVYTWGSNTSGQLGVEEINEFSNSSVLVSDITDVEGISAAQNHTMVVHGANNVYCWGHNNKGQFFNLSIGTYTTPTQMEANIGIYNDTHGNTLETATELVVNQYQHGTIDYESDVDVFVFYPEISADYIIDVSSDFSYMSDTIIYDLSDMSEMDYTPGGYYFLESGKGYALAITDFADCEYHVGILSAPEVMRVLYSAYSIGINEEIPIQEITSGFIKGVVEVRNSATVPKSFVVVMTLYGDDNALYDVRTVESNVQALTNTKVTCGFNVPSDDQDYRIVLSVYDSLSSMNNISEDFILQ